MFNSCTNFKLVLNIFLKAYIYFVNQQEKSGTRYVHITLIIFELKSNNKV